MRFSKKHVRKCVKSCRHTYYIIPRTNICKWTISFDCTSSLTKLVHLWQDSKKGTIFPCLSKHELVFCYQNCSDLLWEKNALVIKKNFWNLRLKLKAQNFQKLFRSFPVRINWSSKLKHLRFLAFGLEFQKFFLITRAIFYHSKSVQCW